MEKDMTLPNPPRSRSHAGAIRLNSLRVSRWKERLLAYCFLAPSLIVFGIFLFYPLGKSVYLSLFLTDPQGRMPNSSESTISRPY
ncbi:hypothetical protein CPT76_06775 [Paenibacillus sp. AR247]|nr:hypothetical protein CPT76_06775 [Paenibacillus sp. AR247]